MGFDNQNARAKIRLELSEGVAIEVPLAVVLRSIQERYMAAKEGGITFGGETDPVPAKDLVHWGFPDFYSDDEGALVHFIVTTRPVHRDGKLFLHSPDIGCEPALP